VLSRVKAHAIQELTQFDLAAFQERRVFFRAGTIVSVSRRDGPWSCVTEPMDVPTSGSPFYTGWMKTALLEPVTTRDYAPGNDGQ
jgi:hypothetical protein